MEKFNTTSSFDSFELQVTNEAQGYLKSASNWGLFLSIVGFILLGLGLLFSLIFVAAGGAAMAAASSAFPFPVSAFGFIMLFFNILGWLPAVSLFRFCTKIKRAISDVNTIAMTDAFKNLKYLFTLVGIYVIIMIVTYFGLIIYAITAAASLGGGRF